MNMSFVLSIIFTLLLILVFIRTFYLITNSATPTVQITYEDF
ncbi:MAG: hypothetical protein E7E67_16290 [Clostridioides difficile]|nr:hypothetical protein [Clostridioides difficile]